MGLSNSTWQAPRVKTEADRRVSAHWCNTPFLPLQPAWLPPLPLPGDKKVIFSPAAKVHNKHLSLESVPKYIKKKIRKVREEPCQADRTMEGRAQRGRRLHVPGVTNWQPVNCLLFCHQNKTKQKTSPAFKGFNLSFIPVSATPYCLMSVAYLVN